MSLLKFLEKLLPETTAELRRAEENRSRRRDFNFLSALGIAERVARTLKPAEKSSLDPIDRTRKGENVTVQAAFTLDQLPQIEPEYEAIFREHIAGLIGALTEHPDGLEIEARVYRFLEGVAHAKGTNLATIISLQANRGVFVNDGVIRFITEQEGRELVKRGGY